MYPMFGFIALALGLGLLFYFLYRRLEVKNTTSDSEEKPPLIPPKCADPFKHIPDMASLSPRERADVYRRRAFEAGLQRPSSRRPTYTQGKSRDDYDNPLSPVYTAPLWMGSSLSRYCAPSSSGSSSYGSSSSQDNSSSSNDSSSCSSD